MFLVLINNIDEDKAKAALKKEMNVSNELCRRAGRDIPYPEQLSDARFNLFWDTFKVNRYQYPRHFPTSLGTAVQILPEKAHCCNYGV